jgi:hypothetical protein
MKLIDLNTVPQQKPREIEIGPYTDPKEFLQQVMAAVELPLAQRMRAGIELLPYCHPRLAVTAMVTENDIATLLDRRIARYEQMKNGNLIEQKAIDHSQIETTKPLVRTPDRR